MTPNSRWVPKEIESASRKLLAETDVSTWPVPLDRIADALGVDIEYVDFEDDLSGVLVRGEGNAAIIGVNLQHHPNRRRFTIAHELGHFVMHGGTYVDKGTAVKFRGPRRGSGSQREEREANRFAAALLMPKDWIKAAVLETSLDPATDSGLQGLADDFGVSSLAMSYRLSNLGLLEL